jgi:O-antigen/teichoic acid export membrane protein
MLEVARQAVWTVGLIVLSLLGAMELPLLAMLLVANLVMIAPTWLLTHRLDSIRVALRPRAWPPLLGETAMFSLATAVGTIYLYMTQIVTSLVASPHQSGLFSASFRIYIVTAGIPGLVGASALPVLARAARDNHDQLTYVVKRFIEVSVAAGIGIALVMAAASHFVILLLAGHKFRDATGVLEIQAFAMIATFVTAPCSYGLVSLRMYRQLLWANGCALAVTLAATIILVHSDGARGAAIATILGETTVSLLMLIALLRRNRSFTPHLRLLSKLALATALAAPLALESAIPSLPRAIATGCLYLLVVLMTRALPDEVMQMLPLPAQRPRSA